MRLSVFATLASLALCHAGYHEGFTNDWSFDLKSDEYPDWMSKLVDDVPLSLLSIPGTHNSLSYKFADLHLQGQNIPLQDQLTAGIRYIDVSCHTKGDDLLVYHGLSSTDILFQDVMKALFNFLDRHPGETVILRIQKHNLLEPSDDFVRTLRKYLKPSIGSDDRLATRIFSNGRDGITDIPTLGEVRGKVFILQDFKTRVPGRYGLPWSSPEVSVFDFKVALKKFFLGMRWHFIREFIVDIKNNPKLFITHTTASAGAKPVEVAIGSTSHEGMNTRLGKFLEGSHDVNTLPIIDRVGIIAMDYPGMNLVHEILKFNIQHCASPPGPSRIPHTVAESA
ncbi:1-phosphatidylinositol phosphodiesterase [Ceratocystis lukuohia]|uniref:1-phosphatidylinositol phosphodiesterase n=1 Tax=Ceratocystis lukuohia TaxID=2019550 RepID=A0ABR4MAD7_9PEZI